MVAEVVEIKLNGEEDATHSGGRILERITELSTSTVLTSSLQLEEGCKRSENFKVMQICGPDTGGYRRDKTCD
jgi:hypothetical protein